MSSTSLAQDIRDLVYALIRGKGVRYQHTHSAVDGGLISTDGTIKFRNALQPVIDSDSQVLNRNLNADLWRGHRFYNLATPPTDTAHPRSEGDFCFDGDHLYVWDNAPTPQWREIANLSDFKIDVNGNLVAARPELNLIQGSNVTITGADNPTANRVDVTIASTGGGSPHPLLDGSVDSDTAAHTPSKGDLIHANASNLWDGLGIGSAGQYLRVSSGDVAWSSRIDTETGAALPAAGDAGRLFQRTSDNTLWFDTGTVWVQA